MHISFFLCPYSNFTAKMESIVVMPRGVADGYGKPNCVCVCLDFYVNFKIIAPASQ